jgi:hypothetical protein
MLGLIAFVQVGRGIANLPIDFSGGAASVALVSTSVFMLTSQRYRKTGEMNWTT